MKHGIDYLQFSFRWLNNLLTRELPLRCSIRLWDTYLAESDCFATFQLYVCAAFLLHWRQGLLEEKDFQVINIDYCIFLILLIIIYFSGTYDYVTKFANTKLD